MIHIKKFRHIALVARDLDKMISFYTQVLGFEIKRRFEIKSDDFQKGIGIVGAQAKGAHLAIPNSDIEMELFEFTTPLLNASGSPGAANNLGYRHIALVVDDLQSSYLELKTKGIVFISEPILVKEPEEVARFQFVYFRDPEGNIVELNQLPEWV